VYVHSYFKYMKVYSNHTFTTPVFLNCSVAAHQCATTMSITTVNKVTK